MNELQSITDDIIIRVCHIKQKRHEAEQYSHNTIMRYHFEELCENLSTDVYKLLEFIEKNFNPVKPKSVKLNFLSNSLCHNQNDREFHKAKTMLSKSNDVIGAGLWKQNSLKSMQDSKIILMSPLTIQQNLLMVVWEGVLLFESTAVNGYVYQHITEKSEIRGLWRRKALYHIWHNNEVILYYPYKDNDNNISLITATRQDIITFLRNKKGSHLDYKRELRYQNLQKVIDNFGYEIVLYSILSIAYEVEYSWNYYIYPLILNKTL